SNVEGWIVAHLLGQGKWPARKAELGGIERLGHQTPATPEQKVSGSGGRRHVCGVGRITLQACRVFGVQCSGEDTALRAVEVVASIRQENRISETFPGLRARSGCRIGFAALRRDSGKR